MKNHLRVPGACSFVLCALFIFDAASGGVRSAQADVPETANACVGFQNVVGDKELLVHAGNDCERKLSCWLDYEVRCEDNQQKVTSRVQKRSAFNLAAKGNAELTLSAAACKQGWAIGELEWNCR